MTLREQQSKFAHMMALLILYAEEIGYEVTMGDCYRDARCKYGHPRSLHKKRLAVDLNIFKNGKYLQGYRAREAHSKLHDFWDSIGGNERINDDLNHYSFSIGGTVR